MFDIVGWLESVWHRFGLRVDIHRTEMRVKLFQSLVLGLGIACVDQNGGENVECHEDEVSFGSDIGNRDRPDLTNDDRSQGGSGGSDSQAFRPAVGGEDLGSVDPSDRTETHAI